MKTRDERNPHPDTVRPARTAGGLDYLHDSAGAPFNYMYPPPAGEPWENCSYRTHRVDIVDTRPAAQDFLLDHQGFELRDAPTGLTAFDDDESIRARYYPEVEAIACQVSGATRALCFDHQVRRRSRGEQHLSFGRQHTQASAVGRVHNDYSEASGLARLALVLRDEAAQSRIRRFAVVNVWRPLIEPVVDAPLAMCNARSVMAQDLVAAEIRYPERSGEIYLLKHSPQHRWHYFPGMAKHEVLVFKQYDSQASGVSRFTPHAAFLDPAAPADAPLRASIEARCLVLFD
ncbi:CmcJ/NvfI family oxidoreductase [Methyloversatilis sp.]|uniref:CmcJ/NvfI family oxidoreductase n=1 Tax=Methyloversatilis sp. TaxID=2569862 RepID=UPI00273295BE|nr:CmcJ/NvfI family oxidoreductase [Methyloversatilis sp.]MDP3453832.1 CmcJ/NvfI family oxidoreductase [Methyloversatilis sp.]MDP3578711.1 CmcJ/NvfI family oxidoreductase [Methyloversatilis sp.]